MNSMFTPHYRVAKALLTKMSRKVSNSEEQKYLNKFRIAIRSASKYLRELKKIVYSMKWESYGLTIRPKDANKKDVKVLRERLKQIDFALEPARRIMGLFSEKFHIMGYSSTEVTASKEAMNEYYKLSRIVENSDHYITSIEDEIGYIGGVVGEDD